MDDLVLHVDNNIREFETTLVSLCLDKDIYLLRVFEQDFESKKKYIRNACVLVGDNLLTSTFTDTTQFMIEVDLFDVGNEQNKYFSVTEYKNTKNLKLKIEDENVFISKAEAKTIYKLFNLSLLGYSMARVLEYEYRFTPESLTELLHKNEHFQKHLS